MTCINHLEPIILHKRIDIETRVILVTGHILIVEKWINFKTTEDEFVSFSGYLCFFRPGSDASKFQWQVFNVISKYIWSIRIVLYFLMLNVVKGLKRKLMFSVLCKFNYIIVSCTHFWCNVYSTKLNTLVWLTV